jgi:hypothetical protein
MTRISSLWEGGGGLFLFFLFRSPSQDRRVAQLRRREGEGGGIGLLPVLDPSGIFSGAKLHVAKKRSISILSCLSNLNFMNPSWQGAYATGPMKSNTPQHPAKRKKERTKKQMAIIHWRYR